MSTGRARRAFVHGTCGIPGHDRSGREVVAELLSVDDGPLEFELSGKCGYETTFEYSSESA
jgi:hypothetical protein